MKQERVLSKGPESSLKNLPIENGKLRFTTDTGRLFLDNNDSRIEITDFVKEYTESQIKSIVAPLPKIYIAKDTHKIFMYTDRWICYNDFSDIFAPINSPKLTGIPTVPTVTDSNNTTQIANVEYITNRLKKDKESPQFIGTPTTPTAETDTHEEQQIVNIEFLKAMLELFKDSPNFRGYPTVPDAEYFGDGEQIVNINILKMALELFKDSPEFRGTPKVPFITDEEPDQSQIVNFGYMEFYIMNTIGELVAESLKSPFLTGEASTETPTNNDNIFRIVNIDYIINNIPIMIDGKIKEFVNSPTFSGTPTAPTPTDEDNTQQITNVEFVKDAIAAAIEEITQIDIVIVDELPEYGEKGVFYFKLHDPQTDKNIYDEYVYINEKFEKIGSTEINLSEFINTISIEGTGNAITGYTKSGQKLILKKDTTFLTQHPTISNTSKTSTSNPKLGEVINVVNGVKLDSNGHITEFTKEAVTLPEHVTVTTVENKNSESPEAGETINVITGFTVDKCGHLTGVTKTEITLPETANRLDGTAKITSIEADSELDFGDLDS